MKSMTSIMTVITSQLTEMNVMRDRGRDRRDRNRRGPAAERGVGDVPAIELSEGQQVQRCRQHPEPRGEHHRMDVDRIAVAHRDRYIAMRGQLEEQRLAKIQDAALRWAPARRSTGSCRRTAPARARRTRAIGPATPMSNRILAGRERFPNLDDRAERPGQEQQRRHRNEVGKRRVDVVSSAEQVVPHLVGAENAEQRAAVPEALKEDAPSRAAPAGRELGHEREIMQGTGHGGADDGQEEQQHVQPQPALELAAAWRDAERGVERLERKRSSGIARIVGRVATITLRCSGGPCRA